MLDNLIPLATREDVTSLLDTLQYSRNVASKAVKDEDVSMAFQEALLKDWGDGVRLPDEDTETTARLSLLHGSASFFLAQEAGAVKAIFHLLELLLFENAVDGDYSWDRVEFSEPHLKQTMKYILETFLASEENDGHLVDYSVWRSAGENGGKVALYCTSFASVTIDVLKAIRSMRHEQFDKYMHEFFPMLCALIRVQCDEIRRVVRDVMEKHVARYLGV